MKVDVRCPGCGAKYSLDETLLGRKLKCKKCQRTFKVEASIAEGHGNSQSSAPAAAQRKPEKVVPEDVYGLDEAPLPPRRDNQSGGSAATESSEDRFTLPRRPGSTAPLTEAQKKKIAKRADRIERSKPFHGQAAFGVSFAAVFAIALFGWRVHRQLTKAERLANRNRAAQSAPAEVLDLKGYFAEVDEDVEEMISKGEAAEARDWLDSTKHQNHEVAEMSLETAREVVNGFYERGAGKVYVLGSITLGGKLVTPAFAIKLLADDGQRKLCYAWKARFPNQTQNTPEFGQKYLLFGEP
jgi:predicted Zn finger-like uncharacterized protein